MDINLEQTTGFLLIRLSAVWERKIEEAVSTLDLTKTQFFILSLTQFLCSKEAVVTQSDIAQCGGMDLMMVSQVARRLEAKSFLQRKPHPTDSRSKVLSLTAEGTETMLLARSKVLEAWQIFVAGVPEGELGLKAGLEQFYQANIKSNG